LNSHRPSLPPTTEVDEVTDMTQLAGAARPDIPRPEHPRPQMIRPTWLNLNGNWNFEIDHGDSGWERGLLHRPLSQNILVPFAPESVASGIGKTDFMAAVWYRRTIEIPADWTGLRPLLHFGAVDFDATVWADGFEVARHRGGFTPFTADLQGVAAPGKRVTITVRARDSRHDLQARGKQATWYANSECSYTRTTGIWQTVWLEGVPPLHLRRPRITPDLGSGTFNITAPLSGNLPEIRLRVIVSDQSGTVATAETRADLDLSPTVHLVLPRDRIRPWSPADPHLYQVRLELIDATGDPVDILECYAGLRSVAISGTSVLLNGEPVFQRLVLDQGYWPDTLMTAPDDQALIRDIELGLQAGFNGARLHQKVFEERYLYHADRLGYLCWAEFGDWGVSGQGPVGDNQHPTASFVAEWTEVLERDHNHPSIIGWCPLNETHQVLHDRTTVLDDVTQAMFRATKLADPSRPVIDASGYSHRVGSTDIYDSHSYEQDPAVLDELMSGLESGQPFVNTTNFGGQPMSLPYRGQPYFVSEFGGIWWDPDQTALSSGNDVETSWGYGQRVGNEDEFHQRFAGLVGVLLGNANMFGYCYTQLTDVFQEQNGIYRFDRSTKLDVQRVRAAQLRDAAFEHPATPSKSLSLPWDQPHTG
jgi:hypothetical protein